MWAAAIGPPPTTQKLTLFFTPFSCLSAVGTPPPSSFVLRLILGLIRYNRYQPSWVCFGDGFSAEIAPVFPGIVGHDASQQRKEYSECYNTNVRQKGRQPYLCKTRPVVQICLQFRLVTISIAKTKAEPLAEFSASVVMRHFVWETE